MRFDPEQYRVHESAADLATPFEHEIIQGWRLGDGERPCAATRSERRTATFQPLCGRRFTVFRLCYFKLQALARRMDIKRIALLDFAA